MGWQARLQLEFEHDGRRTRLIRKGSVGPLCVQKPFYPEGEVCHAYLLHPPGVVAGGDQLTFDVDVRTDARVLLTTPAATKFLRSNGPAATQEQTIRIEANGFAEWLPQETIVFNGANAWNKTVIQLEPNACVVATEVVSLARPTNAERFENGNYKSQIRLERYCPMLSRYRPVYVDRQHFGGGAEALDAPWGLAGKPVLGTLLATPADTDMQSRVRDAMAAESANLQSSQPIQSTLVHDVLVIRCTGQSAPVVQGLLRRCWATLRPILLQREPCAPAIWRT